MWWVLTLVAKGVWRDLGMSLASIRGNRPFPSQRVILGTFNGTPTHRRLTWYNTLPSYISTYIPTDTFFLPYLTIRRICRMLAPYLVNPF